MTEKTLRIALIQQRAMRSIDDNLQLTVAQIRDAAAQGARYVQTPECTNCLELNKARLRAMIGTPDYCDFLRALRKVTAEVGVWLHIGSMTFNLPDDKIANRAVLIAPDGTVAATYDKIHMFDVDLDGGESYRESRTYAPGDTAVLVATDEFRLGLSICYDLRFPHLYRELAQAGAEMLAIPAAFTRQTGQAHWNVLQRARAIETGCFVCSAAQGGKHECGRETFGHSIVVNPWGEVVAEAGEEPCVLVADINLADVETARSRVPSLANNRQITLETVDARDARGAGGNARRLAS